MGRQAGFSRGQLELIGFKSYGSPLALIGIRQRLSHFSFSESRWQLGWS
jgi:hypothetical protein